MKEKQQDELGNKKTGESPFNFIYSCGINLQRSFAFFPGSF